MPIISVIMPVYNESIDDLNASIESVLNQTYKDFELIIIDDNPLSNNIKNYLLNKQKKDKRIRLIFNKNNLKLAKSENKGINHSNGKYILRIDADDIAKKNRLYKQFEFLKNNDLSLTYCNCSLINNVKEVIREFNYGHNDQLNQKKIKKLMTNLNVALGPTLFFKKELFNDLNGYRNMNCEDYDFVTRVLINNYKIGYQGEPLLFKKLRKNSISYNSLLYQYILMNTIGSYLKQYNYTKIIPLKIISNEWNKISLTQQKRFNQYADARYNFSDKKNLINIIILLKTILTSKIVLLRCIKSITNKIRYKYIYN